MKYLRAKKKIIIIITTTKIQKTAKACPFSRSLDKRYAPLPARCAKLLSFFSAFRLPFRDLTRWHLEGHSPAKRQTNCDSYNIKSATVDTAWTKRFLYHLPSV